MLNVMSRGRNAFIPDRECEGKHSLWKRWAEENRVDGDIGYIEDEKEGREGDRMI